MNNFSILSDELIKINKTEQGDEAIIRSNQTIDRDQSAKADKSNRLGNRAYNQKSEIENPAKSWSLLLETQLFNMFKAGNYQMLNSR